MYETVMSEEAYKSLPDKLQGLVPTTTNPVQTAKAEENLKVLGKMAKKLHFHFPTCPDVFAIQPVILRGLSMPLNLGYDFLSKEGIVVDPRRDRLLVRGRAVLLPVPRGTEPQVASLVVRHKACMGPGQLAWVKVGATNFQGIHSLDGLIEVSLAFEEDHQVVGWRSAVQRLEDGCTMVAVINPGTKSKVIRAGVI